jgi:hypothetical protein
MTKWAELQRLNDLNKDRYIFDLFDEKPGSRLFDPDGWDAVRLFQDRD